MGLLDQLTSMASNLGGIAELMNNPQIKQLMDNPQIANLVKNLDQDTIQKLVSHVQTNGIPKDMAGIQKVIETFTKK